LEILGFAQRVIGRLGNFKFANTDSSLTRSVPGFLGNNPIEQVRAVYRIWDESILHEQRGDFVAALDAMRPLELTILSWPEGVLVNIRPMIMGRIALLYKLNDDLSAGKTWTKEALASCRIAGDVQGMRIYRNNLTYLHLLDSPKEIRADVSEAQRLSDLGFFEESNSLLFRPISTNPTHFAQAEPGVLDAKIYGLIGFNFFQLGDFERAYAFTERALELARTHDDPNAITIYTLNLGILNEHRGRDKSTVEQIRLPHRPNRRAKKPRAAAEPPVCD
jgi:hypothetical protein